MAINCALRLSSTWRHNSLERAAFAPIAILLFGLIVTTIVGTRESGLAVKAFHDSGAIVRVLRDQGQEIVDPCKRLPLGVPPTAYSPLCVGRAVVVFLFSEVLTISVSSSAY